MTALDVCAGAGGLSYGLHQAGFLTYGVELHDDAAESHRRNVGPCDTADAHTWAPPGEVDVVAGGVPCQPFSTAGERRGLDDPRASLVTALARIARESKARAVLVENVPGLLSCAEGRCFAFMLEELSKVGFPHASWRILSADAFGVPQRRRRVYVVAFREPTPFEWPEGSTERTTVRQALGLVGDFEPGRIDGASGWNGQRCLDVDRPAPTVGASSEPELLRRRGEKPVRLTLEQVSRLMSYPDSWRFVGDRKSRLRQIGNGVCPPVARALGLSLRRSLQ